MLFRSWSAAASLLELPLLLLPLLLRVHRLTLVFHIALPAAARAAPSFKRLRSIRETRLLWWVLVAVLPVLALLGVFLGVDGAQAYFPGDQLTACRLAAPPERLLGADQAHALSWALQLATAQALLASSLLGLCLFRLRKVADDFGVAAELRLAAIVWTGAGFASGLLVVFTPLRLALSWSVASYFAVARNLALFLASVALPLRQSFLPAFQLPRPLETQVCASSFALAVRTRLPALFFNHFLRQASPASGLLQFQLFMDIRLF